MIRQRKPIARNGRPKAKRSKPRRVSVLRDRKYLDYLREQKCIACDRIGEFRSRQVDPAHGPVNGRGSKGADNEAIPLCRHHHIEQHRLGWDNFQRKYGIDREKEASTFYAAWLIVSSGLSKEGE